MKIIENILTKNPCYKTGRKIAVGGLMLHSVGVAQPSAMVFINTWNQPGASACVHGIIDGNTGDVYQTLPWGHRGWHCGPGRNGSGNNNHIGVEMCEPPGIQYTSGSNFTCTDKKAAKAVAKRTYKTAVELFAMLCIKYGLDPMADGVVISHREGHARGVATNHGDPEHLWEGLGLPYTMDTFRKAVAKKVKAGGGAAPKKPAAEKAVNYKVRVTAKELNVRKGPGTNYPVARTIRKGEAYTITAEEKNGGAVWGKLKSGAGYISLSYTQKV